MTGESQEPNPWDAPMRRNQSVEITPEILQKWCAPIRSLIPPNTPAPEAQSLRAYALAQLILSQFLGWDWIRDRVHSPSDPNDFLWSSAVNKGSEDQQRHLVRVILLGEFAFNFQKVPGIIDRLLNLTDRIEPPLAELNAAMILYRARIPFRFVRSKSVKGSDYDIELLLPSGRKACAETKCKVEETELTVQSVRNSLETARRQLPKDEPGVVFLSLPERSQRMGLAFHAAVDATIKEFLRHTGRVGLVVVYTSAVVRLENGNVANAVAVKEVLNTTSRFAEEFSSGTLLGNWTGTSVHWTKLIEVCPPN